MTSALMSYLCWVAWRWCLRNDLTFVDACCPPFVGNIIPWHNWLGSMSSSSDKSAAASSAGFNTAESLPASQLNPSIVVCSDWLFVSFCGFSEAVCQCSVPIEMSIVGLTDSVWTMASSFRFAIWFYSVTWCHTLGVVFSGTRMLHHDYNLFHMQTFTGYYTISSRCSVGNTISLSKMLAYLQWNRTVQKYLGHQTLCQPWLNHWAPFTVSNQTIPQFVGCWYCHYMHQKQNLPNHTLTPIKAFAVFRFL